MRKVKSTVSGPGEGLPSGVPVSQVQACEFEPPQQQMTTNAGDRGRRHSWSLGAHWLVSLAAQ